MYPCSFYLAGALKDVKLHGLCWRSLLGLIPDKPPMEWAAVLQEKRQKYEQLKDQYYTDPTKVSSSSASLAHIFIC